MKYVKQAKEVQCVDMLQDSLGRINMIFNIFMTYSGYVW